MLRCVDCYIRSYQRFKATRLLDPEDEGITLLQNVGNCLSVRHGVISQNALMFSKTAVRA
jgi:hypothetical protein